MFYAAGFQYEVIFKTGNGESANRRNRGIGQSENQGLGESGNQGIGESGNQGIGESGKAPVQIPLFKDWHGQSLK